MIYWLAALLILIGSVTIIQNCGCCCPKGAGCGCSCCGPGSGENAQPCPKAPTEIIVQISGVSDNSVATDGLTRYCDCAEVSSCICNCGSFNGAFVCTFVDTRNNPNFDETDCMWWGPETHFCTRCNDSEPVDTRIVIDVGGSSNTGPSPCGDDGSGLNWPCGYRVFFNAGNLGYYNGRQPGAEACANAFRTDEQDVVGKIIFPYHASSELAEDSCLIYQGAANFYDFRVQAASPQPEVGDCCLIIENAVFPSWDVDGAICPSGVLIRIYITLVGDANAPCVNCDDLIGGPLEEDCGCG